MKGSVSNPRVFAHPWEAQVFAMVVALRDSGLFTAEEWAMALGTAIRPDGLPEAPADYGRWLDALEAVLASKRVCSASDIDARRDAFLRAARATPHGEPIRLANDPRHAAG